MMKTGQSGKWLSAVLGIVCVVLLVKLVMQFGGVKARASRRAGEAAEPRPLLASAAKGGDELARYDPKVHLDLLKELQSRRFPQLPRNPFEIMAPPQSEASAPPPEVKPPPPPPIPLKALGYSEKGPGQQEAFVADDEQTYIVHEAETFGQKYKVLKITPQSIEIEDESSHQTIQLPFAQ